jgi:hypothetical protein
MASYDIFNGDADGICSLIQLRRAEPRRAKLITGVKRDIALLEKINPKSGDHLTVLDISMRTNADGLRSALEAGAEVFYVDHHNPGEIPKHENLQAVIDTRPDICTALLVNKCLKGAYAGWAVVAAFGDNMQSSAQKAAFPLNLEPTQLDQLKQFGELINYNGYGRSVEDLHYAPDKLFKLLSRYDSPVQCLKSAPRIFNTLKNGYGEDLAKAKNTRFIDETPSGAITLLDDAPWSRRISGSFGNILATSTPSRAHAILTHNIDDSYTVSIRAPKDRPTGADLLCLQFKTGGGRSAAAGINQLPHHELEKFTQAFRAAF